MARFTEGIGDPSAERCDPTPALGALARFFGWWCSGTVINDAADGLVAAWWFAARWKDRPRRSASNYPCFSWNGGHLAYAWYGARLDVERVFILLVAKWDNRLLLHVPACADNLQQAAPLI